MKRFRRLLWLLPATFSTMLLFVLFFFFYKEQDFIQFKSSLQNLNIYYLTIGIGCFLISAVIKVYRIMYIMPLRSYQDKKKAFFILLGSFPLGFFLAGSGIAYRIFLFKEIFSYPIIKGILNTLLERVSDLFLLIIFFLISVTVQLNNVRFFPQNSYMFLYLLLTSVLLCMIFITSIYFRKSLIRLFLNFLPKKIKHPQKKRYKILGFKFKRKLVIVDQSFALIDSSKKSLIFFMLTICNWVLEILFIHMVLKSLQIDISYLQTTFIIILTILFLLLPLSFSGIGFFEFGFESGSKLLGLEESFLLPSLIVHFLLLVLNSCLIAFSVHRLFYHLPGIKKLFRKFIKEEIKEI